MKLFRTYELEVKSNRPIDKVIDDLKERASFNGNSFTIYSKMFSIYRGTDVEGRVEQNDTKTIVNIKISMSADSKAMVIVILLVTLIFPIMFLSQWINEPNIDYKLIALATLSYIGVVLFFFLLMILMFRFSVWIQKESLIGLIK